MLSFYLIKAKFSNTKELAIHFTINKEKSTFEENYQKFFYLVNSEMFIPESVAFSKFGDFSKIKGFDLEDYVDSSSKNEKKYNELYHLLRNIYLHELIYVNLSEKNKFLISESNKDNISPNKIMKIQEKLTEKLNLSLREMVPAYYSRYCKFMQEEYKTKEEWALFYNVDLNSSQEFNFQINEHQINYTRIGILKILVNVHDIVLSDRLKYDLKTYFTEPI